MKCIKCNKEMKTTWGVHTLGEFLCYNCYRKGKTYMPPANVKVLSFIFMLVLCIGFISALEFDNIVSEKDIRVGDSYLVGDKEINYNKLWEKYKPIEIKNAFGLGESLFSGALVEHTESCGENCLSELELYIPKDGVLIEDLIWKRSFDNQESWEDWNSFTNWNIQIENKNRYVEQDTYSYVCEKTGKLNLNGTAEEICSQVKTGTREVDTGEWLAYSLGSEVKAGTYKVRLTGSKKSSTILDWQIVTQGKVLNEWAVWENQLILSEHYTNITNLFGGEIVNYNKPVAQSFTIGNVSQNANIIVKNISLYVSKDSSPSNVNFTLRIVNMGIEGYPNGTIIYSEDYSNIYLNSTKKWVNFSIPNVQLNKSTKYAITYNTSISTSAWVDGSFLSYPGGQYFTTSLGQWGGGDDWTHMFFEIYGEAISEGTITLNSPSNGETAYSNPTTFNATAEVTGGAYLTNMSFCSNITGSWGCGDSINIGGGGGKNYLSHGMILETNYGDGITARTGTGINVSSNPITVVSINKTTVSDVTHGFVGTTIRGSEVGSCTFTGDECTFSSPLTLNANSQYFITTSKNGGSYQTYGNDTAMINATNSYFKWVGRVDQISEWSENNLVQQVYSINLNVTTELSNSTQTWSKTIPAGSTLWNVQACDTDGDCGFATSNYTVSLDATAPTITINSGNGTQNYGSLTQNHTINFTVTDGNLDSCSYYYDGNIFRTLKYNSSAERYNFTSNITGSSGGQITMLKTVGEQRYSVRNSDATVAVSVATDGVICDWSNTSNYIMGVYSVSLTNNVGKYFCVKVNNATSYLNRITAIDTFDYINATTVSCSSGVENSATFQITTKRNMTISANDTAGNVRSQVVSWDYNIFDNGQTYISPAYETQTTNFAINITYNTSQSLSAILNYDGANYTSINTGSGANGYFTTQNFDIPLIDGTTEKTFFWYLIYGSTTLTTSPINQTIAPLLIAQCNGTYTIKALNFTFYDELTQLIIDGTTNATSILFNIDYWVGEGNTKKNYTFQNLTSSLNSYSFCILNNTTYQIDMDMQYYTKAHAERTYYFRNHTINNQTQNITLYNLAIEEATKFEISVKQGTSVFTEALVNVYKYFVGLNTYKIVMVGLTDDKGKFTANIDLDQSYKFEIIKQGTNYGTFNKQSICLASPCLIDLFLDEETLNPLDPYYEYFAQNVDYNLTYNDTTQMVTLNFVDNLGTANYWRLHVFKGYYENDSITTICDTTTYSPSGTITCNYTGYDGNLMAKVYISRSPEKLVDFLNWMNSLDYKTFGNSAILASVIIILVLFFTGIRNPVNALILIPFALVILKLIQFLPFSWGWIVGLLVMDIWLISKLKT